MKARLHQGGFDDSMSTMKEIGNSIEDVINYFSRSMVEDEGVDCFLCKDKNQYSFTQVGVDDRIGWQAPTYLVTFEGWGVVGMISELPISKERRKEEFEEKFFKIGELINELYEEYGDIVESINTEITYVD